MGVLWNYPHLRMELNNEVVSPSLKQKWRNEMMDGFLGYFEENGVIESTQSHADKFESLKRFFEK